MALDRANFCIEWYSEFVGRLSIDAKAVLSAIHSWPLVHSRVSTTTTHMSYGITQFCLPPDRVSAITPAKAAT